MITIFYLIALCSYASTLPHSRCFSGGQKMFELTSKFATSELCLKDDVSQVKINTEYKKNESGIYAVMTSYRKWIVTDWHECRPKKTQSGSITIIEIDRMMQVTSATYTCDKDCTINIDKENAQVILHTDGINNFEISGTTVIKAWFKSTATVPLQQTCEHIKIICGKKSIQFHSCFRHHMSCIRYLRTSMVPGAISIAICQNLELLIMTTITLIIFSILILLAKTYFCYILLPIFMPIAYIYGFIYDKSCKKCKSCGLASHPFTKCGEHCVCGGRFETSERMKLHRESGLCTGYKSIRTARVLCKAKGSALTLSIILSILLLGFLTPVQGRPIEDTFTINELPDIFNNLNEKIISNRNHVIVSLFTDLLLISFISLSVLLINRFVHSIANIYAIYCNECDMYHLKKDLKYFGDFTNKCGKCTCGMNEEYNGVIIHKRSEKCLVKFKIHAFKHILCMLIVLLLVKDVIIVAESKKISDCIKTHELEKACTGPMMEIEDCTLDAKEKKYEEIYNQLKTNKTVNILDKSLITSLQGSLAYDLSKLHAATDYHMMLTIEIAFLLKHCDFYNSFDNSFSQSQIQWQAMAKKLDISYCREKSSEMVCKCVKGGDCTGLATRDTEINSHYNSKGEERKSDFIKVLSVLKYAFPGTGYAYLANLTTNNKLEEVKNYIVEFQKKHPANDRFTALMHIITGLLKTSEQIKINMSTEIPRKGLDRVMPGFTDMLETNFDQDIKDDGLRCQEPRLFVCISPRSKMHSPNFYICKLTNKLYIIDTEGSPLMLMEGSPNIYCVGDRHCVVKYRKVTKAESEEYRHDNACKVKQYTDPVNEYSSRLTTCQVVANGKCYTDVEIKSTLCSTGKVYPTALKKTPKETPFPNEKCFDSDCKIGAYPFSDRASKNCTWEDSKIPIVRIKKTVTPNFQEYKDQIIKKMTQELSINQFHLTSNLPHFIPTTKYLDLKGVDTTDGVENSFVLFDIPAITGTSIAYNVRTKNGLDIFQMIIYVASSRVYSSYSHEYSTGPTISINNAHEELCNKPCPKDIPHSVGWATFSKERTSNWGCEEFGCLAIDTGCLYGSCQDIIRKELDVFSKIGSDTINIDICITIAHETYCHKLDSTTPIISEKFELQLKSMDITTLPRIVALKGHKLYTGQINDLGSFGKFCGNVQLTRNTTLGQADVKFDYTCHAAQRKDIIIRKCFENNYESCKLLKEESDLFFEEETSQIQVSNNKLNLGTITVKALLGDFTYKVYTEKLDLDVEVSCVGCVGCTHGIICELIIKTTVETTCPIISPCPTYINRMIIKPEIEKYTIKMMCERNTVDNSIELKICNIKAVGHVTIIHDNSKIEMSTGEQSTYIHEVDLQCATWLCKFKDEGFNFIFNPLFSWLGSFKFPVIIVLCIILALGLFVYIFLPMILKLKETLRRNEYEYLQELKANKPSTYTRVKPFA
ncbi:polyprotein [Ketapang virus]|uniref:Envelopment polyprotein n=1 Tax=Ketapang virus TaxID=2748196 RepID=A0A7D9MVX4_9VIRU|nr:polyprotein [Ketapang virus]QLA47060.1 polyprotein [Ketapang virus]